MSSKFKELTNQDNEEPNPLGVNVDKWIEVYEKIKDLGKTLKSYYTHNQQPLLSAFINNIENESAIITKL